jgi:heme/copper-type cytochrome/quinol oxidase subunit 3
MSVSQWLLVLTIIALSASIIVHVAKSKTRDIRWWLLSTALMIAGFALLGARWWLFERVG